MVGKVSSFSWNIETPGYTVTNFSKINQLLLFCRVTSSTVKKQITRTVFKNLYLHSYTFLFRL